TTRGQIVYSITEETERGVSIGNIAKDLGINAATLSSRKFRMITSSSKQYFNIDVSTGALTVKEPIDREQVCELKSTCFLNYELVLENPLELYRMKFKVLDINDNSPSFPLSEYHVKVAEFLSPGARFTLPMAQDSDEGSNGDPDVGTNSVQSYQLSPSHHFALDLKGFQRGSKLLELVLQQPLDREQSALQQLVLTAVDGGDPPKSGTAQISVRVVDTNDNPPAFDRSTYTVSLLENALPGTLVVKLNASDPDEGSNGDVIYSFGSYTPQKVRQLFSVDPRSGEVRVNGTLDYEEASFYEIYVQATDQGPVSMAGHCKVLVNIVDANDNVPEVELTSLYSPVPEDAKAGTVVALMSVTDQDSGLNKQVGLRIPPGLPFTLNSFKNSYTLVTQGNLDREKAASYNITVTATDSGRPPLSSQKVIHVEISDINDNPPHFEEPAYSVYIPENNPLGVLLCTVKATDPDVAKNAYVSYSLLDGEIEGLPVTSYVSIKSDSGNIYAVHSFDYETLREFQLVVQAQDAGIPPLSSTVTVYIYVTDENDHAPQILYPTSTNTSAALEMIPRSANAGYLVTKVIAIDGDSGQNAWLFFYLVQTSDSDLFRVELHSGEIRTTRKLGEESAPTFNLTVEVRDNGEPAMSSSVAINVAVVDRVSKIIPDTRRHIKSTRNYSEITLYLIIALSAISFVFLFAIIGLIIIKCYRYSLYGDSCCAGFCGVRERCPAEMYKQANNNIDTRLPPGLKVQPHFIEVRGNGSLTKTYCYKACLTAGSGSDTFMFYNTCGPTGTGPSAVMTERHLTGQSGQSAQNLIILKNGSITPNEPKHPNPDWRYSASLRAGMQRYGLYNLTMIYARTVLCIWRKQESYVEDQEGLISSGQQSPVLLQVRAGEVSPPVGAGVNSNSWTFKFGPGNPKQGGPGELPDKFIIPGSPAIISIRQEPPNSQIDKSDFITFGKKEETKKKKKKKKGNKTQEKKEKGNSTTENSDQ
ncbi:PCDC2 protein, partial [Nothoprocta ornata]|nr:PCDC2 protein [Nothoprocta pentlandii]NWY07835.1 PCDC2 protein [Nothoprocta ornata]